MCESDTVFSDPSISHNSFCKILKQLAGQLWQSKLQETLRDPQVVKHLTAQETMNIVTYEQLFQHFIAKELVTATNITLLKAVLGNQDQGHALLRAVYGAGYGREGLSSSEEGSTAERHRNRRSTGSFSSRQCSFSSKMQRDFKQLLRKINAQLDSSEDLGALKLLSCSALSLRQLDGISSALDLFNALKQSRTITMENPEFLYRILHDCGRRDLCDIVDGYVYTCLKKSSTESCAAAMSEKRNINSERRQCYQFVRALKHVGDQLGSDDLATMKLLAGTCIPDSKLERARNVYDFFILLQERGKLSGSDLSFLDQLLEDKPHVIRPLYDLGFGSKSVSSQAIPSECTLGMNFKRLLKTIGWRLTQENIKELKYLCSDGDATLGGIESGIELLSCLEKRGEIGPMNVGYLTDLLGDIGRKDLCTIVNTYTKTMNGSHSMKVNGEPCQLSSGGTEEHTISAAPSTASIHSTQANGQSSEPLGEVRRLTAALSVQSTQSEPALYSAQLTESMELLLALSRQMIHHDSVLRSRERVCEDLERRMASELEKKNKQIEELTKTVESQQILLRELTDKLGIHVDSL